MSLSLRYPNITAGTEKEQLSQIKSYLHQLVDQLNYAPPNIGSGDGSEQATSTYEVQGGNVSYYELRSLIIQELQKLDQNFAELSSKMQSEYVSDKELPQVIEDVLTQAKESGEFDGPKGEDGEPGYSPDVTVEPISGGHRVSIGYRDPVNGALDTVEFDVMDGKDAIAESGTVNGWTYTKLENGIYDMFGEFVVTTTEAGTAIGSMYSSEVLTLPTPFAISSAIVYGSASDYFMVTNAAVASEDAENNISFALLRPDTFDAETEVTVRLHATGTFNQGGTE